MSTTRGLYYKHITIVSIINKFEASVTNDVRVVVYNHHMFIVQATGYQLQQQTVLENRPLKYNFIGTFLAKILFFLRHQGLTQLSGLRYKTYSTLAIYTLRCNYIHVYPNPIFKVRSWSFKGKLLGLTSKIGRGKTPYSTNSLAYYTTL